MCVCALTDLASETWLKIMATRLCGSGQVWREKWLACQCVLMLRDDFIQTLGLAEETYFIHIFMMCYIQKSQPLERKSDENCIVQLFDI